MTALWTALFVLIADQFSKIWIRNTFGEEEILVVLPYFFNITYIRNRGGAFGIFPQQPLMFIVLSVVTILAIVYFYRSIGVKKPAFSIGIGLVLGGAAGNLLDRLFLDGGGGVTDWLDFHAGRYHWPAFNVADSAICIGVFMLLYLLLFRQKDPLAMGAEPRSRESGEPENKRDINEA